MSLEPSAFSSPLWLWFSEQVSWADDVLLPKGGDLILHPFSALRLGIPVPRLCQTMLQAGSIGLT